MNINNRLINVWIECFYTLVLTLAEDLDRFVKSIFSEDGEDVPPSFKQMFARRVFGRNYFGPTDATRCFGIILDRAERAKLWNIPFTLFQLIEFQKRGYGIVAYIAKDPVRIAEHFNRPDNHLVHQSMVCVSLDLNGMEQARKIDPCGWYLVPPISDIISVAQRDIGLRALPPSRTSQGIPSVVSEVGVQPMSAWLAAYILLVDFVRVGHPTIGNQSFVTNTELVLRKRTLDRGASGNPDPTLRVVVGPFVRAGLGPESPYVLTISMASLPDLGTPAVASSAS